MSVTQFILINLNLVAFYLLYLLLVKGNTHRVVNRFYLMLVPVLSAILPMLTFPASLEFVAVSTKLPIVEVWNKQEVIASGSNWVNLFFLAGAFLFLTVLIYQLIVVFRLPRSSYYRNFEGSPVFLVKGKVLSSSFFNWIYLNESQLKDEEMILIHERGHCRGWHSLDLIIFAFYKSAFWFNPVIYLMHKRVRENHEFLADQYVIKRNINPKAYGTVLLENTIAGYAPLLSNPFRSGSLLRKRIENLNHKNKYRMKNLIIIPVLAGLTVLSVSMTKRSVIEQHLLTTQLMQTGPDKPASFPGGIEGLTKYVQDNLKYPESLVEEKVEAIVYVSFTVGVSGKLENIELKRGSGHEDMDKAALEFISNMPDWDSAIENGEKVSSEMVLPIHFKPKEK